MERFYKLMSVFSGDEINGDLFNNFDTIKKEKQLLICFFFEILKNEDFLYKVNDINNILSLKEKRLFITYAICNRNFLNQDEEVLLLSFFVLKSLNKVKVFESISKSNFVNSHELINDVYQYIEDFCIFFYHKLPYKKKEIKRLIFSFLSELVAEGIILERTVYINFKTIIEWSSGISVYKINDFDYLNICFSKPEIIEVENLKYLKGCFMNRIQEVFKPNKDSGERVILKDLSFIENLSNTWVKIDENLFYYQVNAIEKKLNFPINDIPQFIKTESIYFYDKLNKKNQEKKIELEKLSKEYIQEKKNYIENFKTINLENLPYLLFLRWVAETLLNKRKKIEKNNYTLFRHFLMALVKFDEIVNVLKNEKEKIKILFKGVEEIHENTEAKNFEEDEKDPEFEEPVLSLDEEELIEEFVRGGNLEKNEKIFKESEILEEERNKKIDFKNNCWFLYIDKKKVNKEIKKFKINSKTEELITLTFWKYKNEIEAFLKIKLNDCAPLKECLDLFNEDDIIMLMDFIGNIHINKYWTNLERDDNFYKICMRWDNSKYSECVKNIKNKLYLFKKEIIDLQKEYSKISEWMVYNNINILKNNLKYINKIYFLFFFDFRGRFYSKSPIGVSEMKFSRYWYYYGEYSEEEIKLENDDRVHAIVQNYRREIQTVKKLFKIEKNFDSIDHALFWSIIAISKIFIKKNEAKIDRNTFLLDGIKNIFKKNYELDLETDIEYNYYIYLIKNLAESVVKKLPIHKDATASVLQNLIRVMGHKDELSLNFCNLNDSMNWYDTYSIILEKWLEVEKNKVEYDPDNYKFFTRKTIKKVIMTKPYAAKLLPSFKRFREKVFEEFNFWIEIGSKEEETFKTFYNFLEKDLEESFFLKNNSNKLISFFSEEFAKENDQNFWIDSHDSSVNLIYYKFVTKTYDLMIKIPSKNINIRKTKKWLEIDKTKINKKKIIDSTRANWIQNIDSIFIRDILKQMNKYYLTIHDCVLVDSLNVSKFIVAANKVVSIRIFPSLPWERSAFKDSFSIFIFL